MPVRIPSASIHALLGFGVRRRVADRHSSPETSRTPTAVSRPASGNPFRCGANLPIHCPLRGGGDGSPAGPMKAKTWSVPGRSSRPSPTDGVGKWFVYPPKDIDTTWCPLVGLRPCTALPAIVQTSPSAMIGVPAARRCQSISVCRYGGSSTP